ncbi:MAG TPA: hypothetical protein VHM88_18150 [Candidatus Acidoferrales bacterium]|nr:hypothetical protein [Candidatus Acidoferrales bacterium]
MDPTNQLKLADIFDEKFVWLLKAYTDACAEHGRESVQAETAYDAYQKGGEHLLGEIYEEVNDTATSLVQEGKNDEAWEAVEAFRLRATAILRLIECTEYTFYRSTPSPPLDPVRWEPLLASFTLTDQGEMRALIKH